MKKYVICLFFTSLPITAYAEVLDKFGCNSPSIMGVLLLFLLCIVALFFFKKQKLALWVFGLSILFIVFYELYPFLASLGVLETYNDSAKLFYYKEVNSCPQYQKIGYWQQVWLSIAVYIFLSIFFLFNKKPK